MAFKTQVCMEKWGQSGLLLLDYQTAAMSHYLWDFMWAQILIFLADT